MGPAASWVGHAHNHSSSSRSSSSKVPAQMPCGTSVVSATQRAWFHLEGSVWGLALLRRVQRIQQQRHGGEADRARQQARQCPRAAAGQDRALWQERAAAAAPHQGAGGAWQSIWATRRQRAPSSRGQQLEGSAQPGRSPPADLGLAQGLQGQAGCQRVGGAAGVPHARADRAAQEAGHYGEAAHAPLGAGRRVGACSKRAPGKGGMRLACHAYRQHHYALPSSRVESGCNK